MKKIILCNPPYEKNWNYNLLIDNFPPMGLILLASVLHNNNYSVQIIDGSDKKDWKKIALDSLNDDILFIGIAVMSSQVTLALDLTQQIKIKNKNIPIVWGGFHGTIFPEQTITHPDIDIITIGEADKTIVQLAEYFSGNREIENVGGIVYKKENKIFKTELNALSEFDEIPRVNYDLMLPEKLFMQPYRMSDTDQYTLFPILAGLGCNFKCAFCHNAIFNKKHRIKSAESIIEDIKFYKNKYNFITGIALRDENFFGNKKRLLNFLDLIEKENINVKWVASMTGVYVNDTYINSDLLKRLKKCGAVRLGVGVESGSPKILKLLKKETNTEQVIKVAKLADIEKIYIFGSFIACMPGETKDDFQLTVNLILRLMNETKYFMHIGPQCFRPYPGSELYKTCLAAGLKEPKSLEDWGEFDKIFSHFTKIDFSNMPWVKKEDYDYYTKRLNAIYLLSVGRGVRKSIKKKILGFGVDILKNIQKYRLEKNMFDFYFEKPIINYIQKKYFH